MLVSAWTPIAKYIMKTEKKQILFTFPPDKYLIYISAKKNKPLIDSLKGCGYGTNLFYNTWLGFV
jgi:hypothetical protein